MIIAGSGPQAESLANYVVNHQFEKLVSFEGYVNEERKMELFANAQLYVAPAPFGESFGIVLLEAMAADLPILAGHNEGYKTVLTGDGRDSLVNPHQSKSFAECLGKLAHNQESRQIWLKWAQAEIQKYDYPVIIDQYENCFKEAVRSRKVLYRSLGGLPKLASLDYLMRSFEADKDIRGNLNHDIIIIRKVTAEF